MIVLPSGFSDIVRERRLLPIIGAGFSKNISTNFPDWAQVIDIAANILGYNPTILKTYGDYLQLAEYLGLTNQLDKLKNNLVKKLDDPDLKVTFSMPHLLLPYLDVQAIYTTNWDSWIEAGFENEKISYNKIVTIEHFNSEICFNGDADRNETLFKSKQLNKIKITHKKTKIVKLHGDLNFHHSFVLKESDYFHPLNFEHPLDIAFRSDILGKAMLFIGYSFTDINIRYMWHRFIAQFAGIDNKYNSYFLSFQENPILEKVLKSKNITVISLDPSDKKESLTNFLKYIIKLQQS